MVERYSKAVAKRTLGKLPRVQPVVERVDYSESDMWKTVAQSAGQLSNQFYQYAVEDARHQSIIDAEGFDFQKGPDGMTVLPPPMTEGGSLYQKNYNAIIHNNYKRNIKQDVEGALSEIFAKEFFNPEEMKNSLNDRLNTTLDVIPPQFKDYVEGTGQAYIDEYYSRSLKEQTRRVFNATVTELNDEKTTLIENRVGPNIDNLQANSIAEDLAENIASRLNMNVITKEQAEVELDILNQFGNWDNILKIINSRSSAEDGELLNSSDKLRALAQMFRGFEPVGDKSTIEFYTTDGTVMSYNKEGIDKLISDKDLKSSIAVALEKRAAHIEQMNSTSQKDLDFSRLSKLYFQNNHIGSADHTGISKGTQNDFWVGVINEDLIKWGIPDGIDGLPIALRNADTVKSVALVNFLIGENSRAVKHKVLPKVMIDMLDQIFVADQPMLANFHLSFYNELIKHDELKNQFNEQANVKTRGYFKGLEKFVGLGPDVLENKQRFNIMRQRLDDSYNEDVKEKMSELTKKLDSPLKTDSVPDYIIEYIKEKDLIELYKVNTATRAQMLDHVLEYLEGVNSGKKDLDIDDINEAIEDIAKKYKETLSDNEHLLGFKVTKEEENSINDNFIMPNTEYGFLNIDDLSNTHPTIENLKVLKTKKNIIHFGTQQSQDHSFTTTVLADTIKAMQKKGLTLDIDTTLLPTVEELYAEHRVLDEGEIHGGHIPDLTPDMYESFTITIDGKEVPLVFGETFELVKGSEEMPTTEWQIMMIAKDGDKKYLLGTLEDKQGKPIRIDFGNALNRKKEEAHEHYSIKAWNERIEKITKSIVGKVPPSGAGGTGITDKSNINQRIIESNKDINNEIKSLNDQIENMLESIKKEDELFNKPNDEGGSLLEDEYKSLFKISYISQIPYSGDDGMITRQGTGAGAVVDAANLIANALPGNNVERTARFLIEIAYMESDFGKHPDTFNFPKKNDMGIWQNERAMRHIISELKRRSPMIGTTLLQTNAQKLEQVINNALPDKNFTFENMNVRDLQIPIISAAVARLYIANQDSNDIPIDIAGRKVLWKNKYNTMHKNTTATAEDYEKKMKILQESGLLEKLLRDRIGEA
mgnify:CR=1 FL=1|tara:strand:- start:21044 stop:24343 length:3300 start_codon:yes stop_codon:yes gene_type:complete